MTPERELARLAILEPAAFEREVAKQKTQQDGLDEQIATFAISQPKAYSAEFAKFKNPERRQKEQLARFAVLNPADHSGSVEALREEMRQKKERGEALDEILDPQFQSRNIPGKPLLKEPKKIEKPRPNPR